MNPSFADLMEDWRVEFNKTNTQKYEMYFLDFTTVYSCMKVKKIDEERSVENNSCIGHLYTEKDPGVEFIRVDGCEFLRPEDPLFFQKLVARVEEKLKG